MSASYNTNSSTCYSFMQNNHMKFLILILSFGTGLLHAQEKPAVTGSPLKPLIWLVGEWERVNLKPGMKAQESWTNAGEELSGLGLTIKGIDTVFLEKIRIVSKEGSLYYVADVKENKEPVYFKFTSLNPNGFICENPGHDFPKKIDYQLNGTNLTVIISGDGKSQVYTFVKK